MNIPILSVRDDEGNVIPIPAIKGKSAYQSAVDGGYNGTEEEFNFMLANAGFVVERPTKTIEVVTEGGEGAFIAIRNTGDSFNICDAWSQLPENPEDENGVKIGAEIKKIEFQVGDETTWTDIHDMHTVDDVICAVAMSKIYRNIDGTIAFAAVSTLLTGSNFITNALLDYTPVKIKITFYDD